MRDVSFLDSLFPDAPTKKETETETVAAGPYHLLPLDAIEPDPNQPRKAMEEEGLQELADSILAHGVLQPITVEALPDGKYRIVTGERRWRAAKIAVEGGEPCQKVGYDLSTIPALVIQTASEVNRLEQQLVENLAREDMSPMDTAKALRALLDLGVSKNALAKRVGRSTAWVRKLLALLDPVIEERAERLGLVPEELSVADAERLAAAEETEVEQLAESGTGFLPDTFGKPQATQEEVKTEEERPEATEEAVEGEEHPEPQQEDVAPLYDGEEDSNHEEEETEEMGGGGYPEESPEVVQQEVVQQTAPEPDTPMVAETPPTPEEAFLTISLPVSVWQALLNKAGIAGMPSVETVEAAIHAL